MHQYQIDSPPVDGVIWSALSQDDLDRFWPLWDELQDNPPDFEDDKWTEALRIAPKFAPLSHLYAQAAYQAGEVDTAIRYWTIAQDTSPPTRQIRAGNQMSDWIIQIGDQLDLPTIDPRTPFQQAAKINGIPAGTLFWTLFIYRKRQCLLAALSLDRMKA